MATQTSVSVSDHHLPPCFIVLTVCTAARLYAAHIGMAIHDIHPPIALPARQREFPTHYPKLPASSCAYPFRSSVAFWRYFPGLCSSPLAPDTRTFPVNPPTVHAPQLTTHSVPSRALVSPRD